MQEIEVNKAIVTVINILILGGLPVMMVWHIRQAKKMEHLSYDWQIQIFTIFLYILGISCEIPALWARLLAYYGFNMEIPSVLLKLTAWDRWARLLFYIMLFFYTYMVTRKKTIKIISDTLS